MQWALNNDVKPGQLFDINACTPLKYYVPSDHSDFPSRKKPARLEWCSGWQFHSRETSPFEQMTSFGRFRCAEECEVSHRKIKYVVAQITSYTLGSDKKPREA